MMSLRLNRLSASVTAFYADNFSVVFTSNLLEYKTIYNKELSTLHT